MAPLLERLGVRRPVVQAGMGGGISRHELAAAVSEAGGLGTIGFLGPDALRSEIRAARRLTSTPVAVNLLLPFTRKAHWAAAAAADVVVTFWGAPRRRTEGVWIHQCGSVEEARAARLAGADAVIAQGREAGGHVRGETPALELLAEMRGALPDRFPLLLAGGIADRADVHRALDAGAAAAVLGTRFLLSCESHAHPLYRRRLLDAEETVRTELFGVGWPGAHRVVPNAATDRWLGSDPRGPRAVRRLHRLSAPLVARIPSAAQARLSALQRARLPLFSPTPPTDEGPDGLLDAGPLYAGETVARIHDVRPAGALVAELSP